MSELTAAQFTIEKVRAITGCPAGVDLQDHLRALVVENLALKAAIKTHSESVHFCQVCGKDDPCSNDDVCYALSETPATDSIVRESEARGVEKFAAKLRIPGDDAFFDGIAEGIADVADSFAKQLREGKA